MTNNMNDKLENESILRKNLAKSVFESIQANETLRDTLSDTETKETVTQHVNDAIVAEQICFSNYIRLTSAIDQSRETIYLLPFTNEQINELVALKTQELARGLSSDDYSEFERKKEEHYINNLSIKDMSATEKQTSGYVNKIKESNQIYMQKASKFNKLKESFSQFNTQIAPYVAARIQENRTDEKRAQSLEHVIEIFFSNLNAIPDKKRAKDDTSVLETRRENAPTSNKTNPESGRKRAYSVTDTNPEDHDNANINIQQERDKRLAAIERIQETNKIIEELKQRSRYLGFYLAFSRLLSSATKEQYRESKMAIDTLVEATEKITNPNRVNTRPIVSFFWGLLAQLRLISKPSDTENKENLSSASKNPVETHKQIKDTFSTFFKANTNPSASSEEMLEIIIVRSLGELEALSKDRANRNKIVMQILPNSQNEDKSSQRSPYLINGEKVILGKLVSDNKQKKQDKTTGSLNQAETNLRFKDFQSYDLSSKLAAEAFEPVKELYQKIVGDIGSNTTVSIKKSEVEAALADSKASKAFLKGTPALDATTQTLVEKYKSAMNGPGH